MAGQTRKPDDLPPKPSDAPPPSQQTLQPILNKVQQAFFREFGVPEPVFEYQFHPARKWRFDMAWIDQKVALEVQGGIFSQGRHTRGPALLKEYEKLNNAAILGWRVLFVTPDDLCTHRTASMILAALEP